MEAKVYNFENLDEFVKATNKLDISVYSKEDAGTIEGMLNRLKSRIISYIYLEDKGKIVGYIEFIPMNKNLYKKIYDINTPYEELDDGITCDDMENYNKIENNIFVLSIVIRKDYQDGEAIILLVNKLRDFLMSLTYPVNSISCCAVSEDGKKFGTKLGFAKIRTIKNDDSKWIMTLKDPLNNEKFTKISYKRNKNN